MPLLNQNNWPNYTRILGAGGISADISAIGRFLE